VTSEGEREGGLNAELNLTNRRTEHRPAMYVTVYCYKLAFQYNHHQSQCKPRELERIWEVSFVLSSLCRHLLSRINLGSSHGAFFDFVSFSVCLVSAFVSCLHFCSEYSSGLEILPWNLQHSVGNMHSEL